MRSLYNFVIGAVFLLGSTGTGIAAPENRYDSYRDLHRDTQYGSLFFNEGAIRSKQSKQRKRFIEIEKNGLLDLPSQDGYCFVFNHYESPSGNDVLRKYWAKIKKDYTDGQSIDEYFEGGYTPTSNVVSPDLPDLCITGTNNVVLVSIEFGSNDGLSFNWKISFRIK